MVKRRWWIVVGVLGAILAGMAAWKMRPLLYRMLYAVRERIPAPIYRGLVESDGSYTNVIFLHHSTGGALIQEGNVRALLAERGYRFWDHGYNDEGLVRPDGTTTGRSYRIPGLQGRGNTDVDGLAALFAEPVTDPPTNAFSRLLQHEVIIVKSCFPNSAVASDEMQAQFQSWYLRMRAVIDQHPDRLFMIVTSPPLHPLATNPDEAHRARAVADWLTSDAYLSGHPNLAIFDLYSLLADPATGMLRSEYQLSTTDSDSHPNRLANETIGPLFVEAIDQAVQAYRRNRG